MMIRDFPNDIAAVLGSPASRTETDGQATFEAIGGSLAVRLFAPQGRYVETPGYFACYAGLISDRRAERRGPAALSWIADRMAEGKLEADQIRGSFALFFYDKHNRVFISIRDAIGVERVWILDGAVRAFSSNLLLLKQVAAADWRSEIDTRVFGEAWEHNFVSPLKSLFARIGQQDIGSKIALPAGSSIIRSHPFRPASKIDAGAIDPESAAMAARKHLALSLRRYGATTERTTVLLSGGVDSTLVADILLENDNAFPVDSLGIGAVLPMWGDEFFARYAARRLKVPFRLLRPGPRALSEAFFEAAGRFELPIFDRAMVASSLLMKTAKQQGSDLVVTGDCADGLFMGQGQSEKWIRESGRPRQAGDDGLASGPPLPDWLSDWGASAPHSAIGYLGAKLRGLGRAFQIDAASPFLDWDVMCLARGLPHQILLRDLRSKALLKDALGGWPSWFVDRRKVSFMFNDKWIWMATNFNGLREQVSTDAQELAGPLLPKDLGMKPENWSRGQIRRNYGTCLKLAMTSSWLAAYGL